jgi:hypothetical protein
MLELLAFLVMSYGAAVAPNLGGDFTIERANCLAPTSALERRLCRVGDRDSWGPPP